jgi:hypothetical protein
METLGLTECCSVLTDTWSLLHCKKQTLESILIHNFPTSDNSPKEDLTVMMMNSLELVFEM